MYSMHLIIFISLLLTLILTLIPEISSYPAYDDVDRIVQSPINTYDNLEDDFYLSYPEKRQPVRRADTSSRNLKTGYYFLENGVATAVRPSGQRRQDFEASNSIDTNNLPSNVRFTPLVRYKQTQTQRKKLFVPNFFG